ncbi:hypothetical protein WJX79_000631 [Trebouxia sp. C0005]
MKGLERHELWYVRFSPSLGGRLPLPPTSYLMPTSRTFPDSQAGNEAYHWPAQNLGPDCLHDLAQLSQAICLRQIFLNKFKAYSRPHLLQLGRSSRQAAGLGEVRHWPDSSLARWWRCSHRCGLAKLLVRRRAWEREAANVTHLLRRD